LVDVVAEAAAERRWAPAALQWAPAEPAPDAAGGDDSDDPPSQVGAGGETEAAAEGEARSQCVLDAAADARAA
jgi:hypothetical protein